MWIRRRGLRDVTNNAYCAFQRHENLSFHFAQQTPVYPPTPCTTEKSKLSTTRFENKADGATAMQEPTPSTTLNWCSSHRGRPQSSKLYNRRSVTTRIQHFDVAIQGASCQATVSTLTRFPNHRAIQFAVAIGQSLACNWSASHVSETEHSVHGESVRCSQHWRVLKHSDGSPLQE